MTLKYLVSLRKFIDMAKFTPTSLTFARYQMCMESYKNCIKVLDYETGAMWLSEALYLLNIIIIRIQNVL